MMRDGMTKMEVLKRAISRRPKVCIHALHDMTDLDYGELEQLLAVLLEKGLIVRNPDTALGEEDRQYLYTGSRKLAQNHFEVTRMSPLIGLDEDEMRNRLVMLERMKRLLIVDWHPILDVIINDYKRDIHRIEVSRYGEDPDEHDTL